MSWVTTVVGAVYISPCILRPVSDEDNLRAKKKVLMSSVYCTQCWIVVACMCRRAFSFGWFEGRQGPWWAVWGKQGEFWRWNPEFLSVAREYRGICCGRFRNIFVAACICPEEKKRSVWCFSVTTGMSVCLCCCRARAIIAGQREGRVLACKGKYMELYSCHSPPQKGLEIEKNLCLFLPNVSYCCSRIINFTNKNVIRTRARMIFDI